MKYPLEHLLDACLTQLKSGEDLEEVLASRPEVADELRPLLMTSALAQIEVPPPTGRLRRKPEFLAAVAARRREVTRTEGVITELRAGVPVEELLERASDEDQAAIVAAYLMYITEPPQPAAERRAADKQVLMRLVERKRAARAASQATWATRVTAALGGLVSGLLPQPTARRRAVLGSFATAAAVLLLALGTLGVQTAAASSLPGETFYSVKRFGESAQLLFAFQPAEQAELELRFSDRRLAEMRQLARDGRDVPASLIDEWLRGQSSAWAEIQNMPAGHREWLTEMLVASAEGSAALAPSLQDSVTDPSALSRMRAWSEQMLARTPTAADEMTDGQASDPTEITAPLNTEPLPVERPLPADDRPVETADEPPADEEPVEAAAPVVPPADEPPADEPPAPVVVQPASDERGGEREEPGPGAGGGSQPPAEDPPAGQPEPPSAEEPAPPPWVQPPIDDPVMPTPTPGDDPGASDDPAPPEEPAPEPDPGDDPGADPAP